MNAALPGVPGAPDPVEQADPAAQLPPAGPVAGPHQYRRLSPLTPLVRGSLLFVAAIGASWQELLRGGGFGMLSILLLAFLVVGSVYGGVSWIRTKYWIDGAELRVDTGVISRQSRRIRIDRLQGIDIVQPLVARFFGLAELRLDVAGGGEREGSLAFLPLREAEELKQLLLTRRDEVRRSAVGTVGTVGAGGPGSTEGAVGRADAEGAGTAPAPKPGAQSTLATLDIGLLVASLVFSWETVGLVVFGLGFGVFVLATGTFEGLGALFPMAVGFGWLLLRRLSAYYGFTVSESPGALHIHRGLFSLSAQTIALRRVQGVVVTEPLLWRIFGWARVDVSVAGYTRTDTDTEQSESTVLPVGPRAQAEALARRVLGGLDPEAVELTGPPRRARWAAPVQWRWHAAGLDDALVVTREGLLTRRTHAVPHARMQSVRLRQGPWQRVLGLATLYVDSPPGPVRVRAKHRPPVPLRGVLEDAMDLGRAARRRAGPEPVAPPPATGE